MKLFLPALLLTTYLCVPLTLHSMKSSDVTLEKAKKLNNQAPANKRAEVHEKLQALQTKQQPLFLSFVLAVAQTARKPSTYHNFELTEELLSAVQQAAEMNNKELLLAINIVLLSTTDLHRRQPNINLANYQPNHRY